MNAALEAFIVVTFVLSVSNYLILLTLLFKLENLEKNDKLRS